MKRILVMLGTVLTCGLLTTPTAQAGNWEETLLDPTPDRIEQGVTYTFGYWILQHGSYPYRGGDLGPTALVATDQKGEVVEFAGVETATPAHYSAEVLFPHDGTWTIGSKQEVLMPDTLVATVTVPGGVQIAPSVMKERAPYEWGAIRPSFPPPDPDAENMPPMPPLDEEVVAATTAPAEVAPRSHEAAVDEPGSTLPVGLVVLGGVATIGFAIWLARRHTRPNTARPPAD